MNTAIKTIALFSFLVTIGGSSDGRLDGPVNSLAILGSDLVIGGEFYEADGGSVGGIVLWDGTYYTDLDGGLHGKFVFGNSAVMVSESSVFAAGVFTTAGQTNVNNVAKWNGHSWENLGKGIQHFVPGIPEDFGYANALAEDGSKVYVGGSFATAGGKKAGNVAMWDGFGWDSMGGGVVGIVYALAVSDSKVYVGGSFSIAGEKNASNLAVWNGSDWTGLWVGEEDDAVDAILFSGERMMYVAGTFSSAGPVEANNTAMWNGTDWIAMGSGLTTTHYGTFSKVTCLAFFDGNLYAGGYFDSSNGIPLNNLAMWDGSVWLDVGGGTDNFVLALAPMGSYLFLGGEFSYAGGKYAYYVASWDGEKLHPVLGTFKPSDSPPPLDPALIASLSVLGLAVIVSCSICVVYRRRIQKSLESTPLHAPNDASYSSI